MKKVSQKFGNLNKLFYIYIIIKNKQSGGGIGRRTLAERAKVISEQCGFNYTQVADVTNNFE